jgi:hypothetical protein
MIRINHVADTIFAITMIAGTLLTAGLLIASYYPQKPIRRRGQK